MNSRIPKSGGRCLRTSLILLASLFAASFFFISAHASSTAATIATPCEMEWEAQKYAQPQLPQKNARQRALAERGDADAQYFMGLTSLNEEERMAWLKKAIAGGSKGAAAYYAYELDDRWKTQPIDPSKPNGPYQPVNRILLENLLKPVIDAAQAGDPQAATHLMQMTRQRWDYAAHGNHPFLKLTDIPKWASIAARGGNPAAAELLCVAHDRDHLSLDGLEKSDEQAFYWCSMAAPRTCSVAAKSILSKLYARGVGTQKNEGLAKYWSDRFKKSSDGILTERLETTPLPMSTR
ncbi:sel1 repeat family protein [Variovorax sp. NFACC27]|mgnify:CR=1 FL=1|jgi:TPR repeat protein|uniref:sel1 repeat family protein n=1 Tax=unclassified Variovorax TaxID=663243 RepID=UPI00089B19B3|nr:sel1 repeat family protein [Variovorax sp. YR750]MDP9606346.1 TPR repeat protein [Variovorax paradoxus]SEF35049.1 hypothetical protein SAMN03159371_07366 [Variovorax sp. NFACC28]SEG98315.1 hypothetical protein SAMN03159365_07164 [Variovorax sp. NFACC29]SFE08277.1 hypothetical protein SAMN03159379_07231 [Variovorax sp. NFACC26]SFH15801.1 hypothetical protein SAMN03159447_06971 [Variovorax sp. NFACC27]